MILSDKDIKKVINNNELIFKEKLDADQIGPASIDLKLGSQIKMFDLGKHSLLDIKKDLPQDLMHDHIITEDEPFIIHPGNFILASTIEYVKVPDNMVLRVEGKSSLARMGILVHTAGFVDPGFEGTITLEISNQSNLAVAIYTNMYICQIAVEYMSTPAEVNYRNRKKSLYSNSLGPRAANTKNLFNK